MEKRLHKTDLGTITYWISYASDTEADVAVQEASCADTAEELTFEPDAAASVTSARLNPVSYTHLPYPSFETEDLRFTNET